MDDLNGLSWDSNPSNGTSKPPPMGSNYLFAAPRRNDTSGQSTPLSASSGPSNPPSKPATPSGDSFANLVSFGSTNNTKNLPLVEQQKRLQEDKARKEAENRARYETQYGGQNAQFWDSLEKGGSKNPFTASVTPPKNNAPSPDEDDILAAFNASAPVDASTHFPVPSPSPSLQVPTASSRSASGPSPLQQSSDMSFMDDDDPFGLNQLNPKSQPAPRPPQTDDDDFLGLLGKPVSELPPPAPPKESPPPERQQRSSPRPTNGVDRAIAELVDMGFPADKAGQALSMTSSGTDVQAAVGLLLTQAHEESRQRSQNRTTPGDRRPNDSGRSRDRSQRPDRDTPSRMQPECSNTPRSRNETRSPSSTEMDPAQMAAKFGTNFLKTANSLWKTGSKKVQQVVNDMNTEQDASQPKWMRDAAIAEARSRERPQAQAQPTRPDMTDEAILLESGGPPRPQRTQSRPNDGPSMRTGSEYRRQESPFGDKRMQQPAFMRQQPTPEPRDARSRLSKAAVEEQSAQAYVSPARRKRPTAPPSPQPAPSQGIDLFDPKAPKPSARPTPPPSARPRASPSPASLPTRPKAPPRVIPQVSQIALSSTHSQREKAAEAYKRGDYGLAHEAFTAALSGIPDKHPIIIVIRSNRAMTALKVGDPKAAINDADSVLDLVGPAKGESESIDLCNGEPHKPMKDFYGKALMRKAEALEQLEKWADAAQIWKLAVEAGHGGSTSIQGRNRCEKAAGISKPAPKPSAPARRPPAPAPKKKASALDDLQGGSSASNSGESFEAVSRLRQANQAAERSDEEKFALTDSVDARLQAWKGGKQDNLRALLGSLDTVLWPEANWKKINMSELIMPNKVKIQYMKGIAKVHPDKISTDATTEQRMIAGAVFGVLNEAWDKFKAENNL